MSTFADVAIGELGEIFDGPHATPTRRTSGSKYFLNISSLNGGRLDLAQSDWVDDTDFATWTRRVQPIESDLLFSYETRLGEAALMPAGIDACLGRRMALIRPDRSKVEPRFFLYAWLSPQFQREITQRAIRGATVDRIPLTDLGDWPIALPPLKTQCAIAEVLGALDDKIAANRRVQESARDLAKSLVARQTATCPVSDLASVSRGTIGPDRMDTAYVTHFSLPAFDQGYAAVERPETIKSAKHELTAPAVLVSKLNPRIPRIWAVDELPEWLAVSSTEFVPLAPKPGVSVGELWAALLLPGFTEQLLAHTAGTTGSHQRVKPAEILDAQIVDVRTLADDRRQLLATLCRLVNARTSENQRLADTRDELLPLLMSGKITVKDAEDRVGETA